MVKTLVIWHMNDLQKKKKTKSKKKDQNLKNINHITNENTDNMQCIMYNISPMTDTFHQI